MSDTAAPESSNQSIAMGSDDSDSKEIQGIKNLKTQNKQLWKIIKRQRQIIAQLKEDQEDINAVNIQDIIPGSDNEVEFELTITTTIRYWSVVKTRQDLVSFDAKVNQTMLKV